MGQCVLEWLLVRRALQNNCRFAVNAQRPPKPLDYGCRSTANTDYRPGRRTPLNALSPAQPLSRLESGHQDEDINFQEREREVCSTHPGSSAAPTRPLQKSSTNAAWTRAS